MASQSATPLETTQGYSTPTVTQFSVFLDNRVGRLHELVNAFDKSAAKICALSVHEASDYAVVRIIANRAAIAARILREQRLPYGEKEVLVVELSEGHSLESLCLSLLGAELNIHFAYPLMSLPNGTATIALSVDDMSAKVVPRSWGKASTAKRIDLSWSPTPKGVEANNSDASSNRAPAISGERLAAAAASLVAATVSSASAAA